ncbi:hypothetical protein TSOC_004428 [Tetrabaena socialis]|uniref:Uncharacterized protein n=1 Tax=Tetrabaena socialis TaxID=47790 RepID=A0A2J8A8W6_9CHLO|nr:hypothetical protein TSOC_004428 [Tetrabaena socialis]|eukprot:PNH08974.1 hypothetical protein TSOC_004428 [Tetrabaena socialis]
MGRSILAGLRCRLGCCGSGGGAGATTSVVLLLMVVLPPMPALLLPPLLLLLALSCGCRTEGVLVPLLRPLVAGSLLPLPLLVPSPPLLLLSFSLMLVAAALEGGAGEGPGCRTGIEVDHPMPGVAVPGYAVMCVPLSVATQQQRPRGSPRAEAAEAAAQAAAGPSGREGGAEKEAAGGVGVGTGAVAGGGAVGWERAAISVAAVVDGRVWQQLQQQEQPGTSRSPEQAAVQLGAAHEGGDVGLTARDPPAPDRSPPAAVEPSGKGTPHGGRQLAAPAAPEGAAAAAVAALAALTSRALQHLIPATAIPRGAHNCPGTDITVVPADLRALPRPRRHSRTAAAPISTDPGSSSAISSPERRSIWGPQQGEQGAGKGPASYVSISGEAGYRKHTNCASEGRLPEGSKASKASLTDTQSYKTYCSSSRFSGRVTVPDGVSVVPFQAAVRNSSTQYDTSAREGGAGKVLRAPCWSPEQPQARHTPPKASSGALPPLPACPANG